MSLREKTLASVDLEAIDGIISFPSVHATVAIILPYTLRCNKFIFWPIALLDGMMIISAVPSGNLGCELYCRLALMRTCQFLVRFVTQDARAHPRTAITSAVHIKRKGSPIGWSPAIAGIVHSKGGPPQATRNGVGRP